MLHPRVFLTTFAVFLCLLLTLREWTLAPDGRLHAYFFDIGQGDATLIVTPLGKQILIDGGSKMSLLEHLGDHLPFFDRSIDLLVLTHPDTDHLAALPTLLDRFRIDRVLLTGVDHSAPRYQALLTNIQKYSVPILLARPGLSINTGDGVALRVLWPPSKIFGSSVRSTNGSSIVLRISSKEHSLLLTGDIEKRDEDAILRSGINISAEILKVPHHGSRSSSSEAFLLAASPSLAIVSVGADNPYGHPHEEILARYRDLKIPVLSTAEEGTIALHFN